ncbi:MAG: glycolate oxidase subunit GlcF, partial [Gammaproteobacteria bacterium]
MQTWLPEALAATAVGQRAGAILRSCVHCGFCNATCPTYQLRG